jgi:hypothetical protein
MVLQNTPIIYTHPVSVHGNAPVNVPEAGEDVHMYLKCERYAYVPEVGVNTFIYLKHEIMFIH